ncbi:MAG: thioesterase family protein [Pseudomonadota bacterium]
MSREREAYRWFTPINTRWADNDIYGHVNNVVYYAYFDTVANRYLIEEGRLDIHKGEVVGFVVSSHCDYFSPVAFPNPLEGGFRVNRLGTSSVEYGIAIFKKGADEACAAGTFTHVFVDRNSQRPVPIVGPLREALESMLVIDAGA